MKRILTCGLEIHAQLNTKRKLFSPNRCLPGSTPNALVSPYDAALPGTQPILNTDCVRLAIVAAKGLNASVASEFRFDRKHYMYPDQPTGYQITQKDHPLASDGFLNLLPRDFVQRKMGIQEPLKVRIKQIQLEQDTGKTVYVDEESHVDLNRTNMPLIEIVTEPDIPSPEAAGVFVQKLQALLRQLRVCTGEFESGALRVDVNVSVDGGSRCEIKNLFSQSAVTAAIRAEFKRQLHALDRGEKISSETRGWDGVRTWKLRGKEDTVDYRYMPEPELPVYRLTQPQIKEIGERMRPLPDSILDELLETYKVKLIDARSILSHGENHVNFFKEVYTAFIGQGGTKTSLVSNYFVHRYLGCTSRLPSAKIFIDLMLAIDKGRITQDSAKLIVKHLAQKVEDSEDTSSLVLESLLSEFGLRARQHNSEGSVSDLRESCLRAIKENPEVLTRIQKGKSGAFAFLVGRVMQESQGTFDPRAVRETLEALVQSQSSNF